MKKPIEVIAVYYPHWHVYPKGNEWFHPGWTEWEYVKDAVPRFPGHRQPIVPLPGYLDGANPVDVAKEIDLAANAGIDVFLYDYYWYDGKVTQEEAIEKGFLGARNRDRMKFAIMWCYHERDRAWRPKIGEKRERLMSLAHTKDEFLGLVRHCTANYFPRPEYWRKDGRLFFSIFNSPYFFRHRESSPERVRAELDEARQIVRAAGLGEIHFNAQGCGPQLADAMADCGFDSTTDYNLTMNNMPGEETAAMREKGVWEVGYRAVFPAMRARWREMAARRLPYIPNVTTGWDVTPRCRLDEPYPWRKMEYPYTMTITDNTPDAFRELLAEAKAFAENDPKRPGAVYINGWNEYTEGTYLLPDAFDGDARLRAIASVFAGTSMDKRKVAVFGGSFSCNPASQVAKKAWSRALGVEVVDFGMGGMGFLNGGEAHNDVPNQILRALASGNRFCAFVLWASTNDIWHTVDEQNAAIERCVEKIRTESPDSAVVLFASMPVPLDPPKNALLGRFVEGQLATCARLGVPCLDLYHRSGITAENAEHLTEADRLHPNEAAYAMVKDLQVEFLRNCL